MPSTASRSWTQSLSIVAVIGALLSIVIFYLESNLDSFYIFNPTQLHDLSVRAIAAHGNDTSSVVAYIVDELSTKLPGGYVNLDEEWIFNNAGGAMGAMYIIHASKFKTIFPRSCDFSNTTLAGITEYLIIFGM